jgi:hypothetical protein
VRLLNEKYFYRILGYKVKFDFKCSQTNVMFFYSKFSKYEHIFSLASVVVELLALLKIFIKIRKHILDPCCHLAAETDTWR